MHGPLLGAYSEGGREAMPPNRRLSCFLQKKRLCWDCTLYQKCSVDLKYAKNALAAGAPPRTPLGELTTLIQTPSRLGRGHPLPNPHSSRRLWRLDSRTFGPQLLCTSVKSWLRLCPLLLSSSVAYNAMRV